MTIVNNPTGRAVVLHELYPTLPDIDFEQLGGRFCPISVCHASLHPDKTGWSCTECPSHWTFQGDHGTWDDAELLAVAAAAGVVVPGTPRVVKVDPAISPRLVLGALVVLAGPGAAVYATASDAAGVVGQVPDGVFLTAATVVAALAVLLGVYAAILRVIR